ncbi:MAG: PAS domain-containing protein, partial [Chitinophagaceae bacterium]
MFTHFHLLLQSVSEGVLMLNPEGYITYSNPAVTALTGYKAQDLLNQSITLLYPNDDDQIKLEYELSQARKNGEFSTQGWKVKKDQTPFWAVMTITPVYDEQTTLLGYGCFVR